jgi:hypothetical protein
MSKSTNKPPPLLPGVEFYMYVGLCITAWAKVDEEIFDVLVDVLGTTRELSSIIYYRITTIAGRLGLVDELVTSVLPKPERKNGGHTHQLTVEWTKTKKTIEDLFSTRTQIAHHPVDNQITLRYKTNGELVPPDQPVSLGDATFENSYSIYVSQSERLRGRHDHIKPLTADALSLHCQAVQAAATKLMNFRAGPLARHLESARKVSAPASPPVRITAGLPKARQTPSRSSRT